MNKNNDVKIHLDLTIRPDGSFGFVNEKNEKVVAIGKTKAQIANRNAETAKRKDMSENTRQPQNNIKPPQRGERLKMWGMFDNIAKAHKSGVIPSKKLVDACYEAGMNVSSAVVQVTYWVQWNGYRRESSHVLTTETAKAPVTAKPEAEKPKAVVKKAALPKPPAKVKAVAKVAAKRSLPKPPSPVIATAPVPAEAVNGELAAA